MCDLYRKIELLCQRKNIKFAELARAEVNQTIIKRIVGHAGAMNLTEKVYTHFDIQQLIDAINKI